MGKKKWAFVPGNQDWMNSHIHDKAQKVSLKANLSFCLICDESDQASLNRIQNFLDDVHAIIYNHYRHSDSTGWVPKASDEVFWLSTHTQSQILDPIIQSSRNAVDQFKSICNCYRTLNEVDELKNKIEALIRAYGF